MYNITNFISENLMSTVNIQLNLRVPCFNYKSLDYFTLLLFVLYLFLYKSAISVSYSRNPCNLWMKRNRTQWRLKYVW